MENSDTSINLHENTSLINGKKSRYNSIEKSQSLDGSSGYQSTNQNSSSQDSIRTLGTFGGVFTPVALCQLSTLLFLRIGFIVGNVGLYGGFGTLVLAYSILLTSVLSVSAISTNGAIEGGGVYFMISRILGPEYGGAIGIVFVFANIIASGLFNIGCIEGLLESFGLESGKYAIYKILPNGYWYKIGYRSCLNLFNLLICGIGAGMFTKTTVFLFVVVFGSFISLLVSFVTVGGIIELPIPDDNKLFYNLTGEYTGLSLATLKSNLYPDFTYDYTTDMDVTYAAVFSVVFSGLTGIMNGANMSGELKNPGFSIPVGTLSAICFTFFSYSVLFVLTAASCSRFLIQNNYNFMMGINIWAPLVTIGVVTSTLSSSLSKMIGASRVLAAIVKDNLFGKLLKWIGVISYGSNPLGCLIISYLIIQCVIMVGELNTIAVITTIFFLMSHMSTSIACFCLEWAGAPNFRPTFQYFSWWTALLGIIGNGSMMFIVSPVYSVICIMVCLILLIGLHIGTPVLPNNWGSISQAILYYQVRKFLLWLDARKDHVKFWRPQILLMVSDPRFCCPLLDFVNDLKKSGLYILGHVMVEEYDGSSSDPAGVAYPKWQALVDHLKIKAFIEVTVADSVRAGVQQLARIAGLGAMKPNIVILGFCDDASSQNFFLSECSPYYIRKNKESSRRQFERIRKKKEKVCCSLQNWNEEEESVTPATKVHPVEYVAIIRDLLNMGKNVCLCRHFQLLDKQILLGRSQTEKHFIDVWPMNFLDFSEMNLENKSSIFSLQLATVLNMVPTWQKKTQLRVFLCIWSSEPDDLEKEKNTIFSLLKGLRINATIAVLSLENVNIMRKWPSDDNFLYLGASAATSLGSVPVHQLTESYLKSVNLLVRENSFNSALSFMTLPTPPSNPAHYAHYIHALTTITHGLPPTILVHGLSEVTNSCI